MAVVYMPMFFSRSFVVSINHIFLNATFIFLKTYAINIFQKEKKRDQLNMSKFHLITFKT